MSNPDMKAVSEIEMDEKNLFREETYTDLRVGSIFQYVPVKPDGSVDTDRDPLFTGEAQIMSPGGPIPIRCRIDAKSLDEAIERFPDAVSVAVQEVVEQVKEIQRQEMSRIVTPDEVAASLSGPGPVAGGRPPGSKILLR